jgi:PAS domain S-box-containing protein
VDFSPQKLNSILSLQHLSADTITAIIDSTGTIAARSHEAEKFIGQKALPELRKQLEKQSQGSFDFTTRFGNTFHATYSRSPSTGWTFVVGVPHQSLEAPLSRNLGVLLLGSVVLLGLSLSSAWVVGKRIAKSVRELHDAAVALGAGELTDMPAGATSETHELSQALQASARILKRRTQQLQTANEKLQERSTELSEAQHIAKTGNWKWHASSGAFFGSEELLRLYGRKILLPFDAQKGKVFPAEAWQKLKTAVKATLQTKMGFSLMLPTLTADGSPLWTRVNGEVVCNAAGEITGLRGTLQDVDVYVKAEMALKDSEARLSLTLSNSDLATWDWHVKTGDIYFDDRWATLQGGLLEMIPNSKDSFLQNVYLEDIPLIQAAVERYFRGETPKYEASYRVHHKDGHCIWLQASGKVVERDAEGMPVRMLGVVWDTTERKRHEIEIAHLQAEMHDVLAWQVAQHTVAALAHEVNQPLASASILCEAASRMLVGNGLSADAKTDKSKRLEQTLQRIASDIGRAGDVLRNLLKSVNQPDITRAPAVVNEVVAESIQTAVEEGVFGYPIVTHYAADLPAVKVNRLQVVKVLLNLIHNAAQAMHEATVNTGKIWVNTALSADGREVCVSVRDDGPGISAALQAEIFQPFITTKSHGLGMGLTISRALIEANGGKLWHSQDDALGATFHFTLPISS